MPWLFPSPPPCSLKVLPLSYSLALKHPDWYSRTKMLAEQDVMAANGSALRNGGKLKVCALRLAGVYGPGERRHLLRIVVSINLSTSRFILHPR